MAKLTDDEQKLLDELTARANEPDAADDYEVEVYDTGAGKGARLPISQAKSWLYENFGIGEPPAQPAADEPGKAKGTKQDGAAAQQRQGYFGRQQAG
jgi:hypothetical protein